MALISISELTKRVGCGIFGGALAGLMVGVSEAFVILWTTSTRFDYSVIAYAAVVYSILGAILGSILSISAFFVAIPFIILWERSFSRIYFDAKERWSEMPFGVMKGYHKAFYTLFYQVFNRHVRERRAFATYFSTILFLFSTIITRYIIKKDLLAEQPIPLPLSILIEILLLILAASFYIFLKSLAGRGIFRELITLKGFGITYLLLLSISFVFAFIPLLIKDEGIPVNKPVPESLKTSPDIILIGIDTLRYDYTAPFNPDITPGIREFAEDSIAFENAFAHSSWTKASFNTIISGLYPSSHQGYRKADILPEGVVTLPEILSGEGYLTGAITNNSHLTKLFNFDQGFDDFLFMEPDFFFHAGEASSHLSFYNTLRLVRERFLFDRKYVNHYYQDAQVILEKAKVWIDEHRTSRYFLFIHLMDPHDPYFRHPYSGEGVARVDTPDPDPERVDYIKELYRGEVEFVDRHLKDFFDHLRREGIYDGLLILLTSDHGEEFYEHGGWWHGTTLYDEQIRVPLILKLPMQKGAGRVEDQFARHIDIAPTILHLAGIKPPLQLPGRVLTGGELKEKDKYIFAEEDFEGNILKASRTEEWKYIIANRGNPRGLREEELYNILKDSREEKDLVEVEREAIPYMDSLIRDTLNYALGIAMKGEKAEMDRTTKERLKALGYVE